MKPTSPLRVGSPFASEPPDTLSVNQPSVVDAVLAPGQARAVDGTTPPPFSDRVRSPVPQATQTSQAAMIAATILVAFSITSLVHFPIGGVAISALGIVMSLSCWTSRRPWRAIGLLGIHGLLFVGCYLRSI